MIRKKLSGNETRGGSEMMREEEMIGGEKIEMRKNENDVRRKIEMRKNEDDVREKDNQMIIREKRKMIIDNSLMIKNLMIIFILGSLLMLILVPGAMSLGITPGKTTISYEKGVENEITFSVLNNEHKNMQVLLTVQGELNESVTLYEGLVEFMPSDTDKQFKYKIKMPENIADQPGSHQAEIVALEVPKAGDQGTFVGATVAVVSLVDVYVSCPGKCIEADLNVMDAEQNSTATFIVPVVNRGELGIGDVRATIDIYTALNEKIDSIETDYYPLEPSKRTELTSKWNIEVPTGNYLAKVTVFYDGESKSFEKQFAIGEQFLTIESILVNNFQLGQIAKLQILVENHWSQELTSVFANLIVYNDRNQAMTDVKSASENIPALSKKELIAYWDTVGVEEGEYNGKLMVKYGQKSTDKNLILKVSEDRLDVTGVGYAIRPGGGEGVNITTILLVLVILLLIVNLAWFVFFRRIMGRLRKKKQNG